MKLERLSVRLVYCDLLQVRHAQLEMDGCHGDELRQMEAHEVLAVCGLTGETLGQLSCAVWQSGRSELGAVCTYTDTMIHYCSPSCGLNAT
jgi:hypothetical protein